MNPPKLTQNAYKAAKRNEYPWFMNPPKLTQNAYKAAKRNEYPCNMSRRVGRNLYETVCRQMQTN